MSDQVIDAERKPARQRVFEAAQALFYERGVRAVGVDEIVQRAGVTKPSLYRAFASKDALVAACLEDFTQSARLGVEAVIAAAGDNPAQALRAVIAHFATKMACADFRGCPMSNSAVELTDPDNPARAVALGCKTDLRDRIAQLAADARADDPDGLADGLMLLVEGAFAMHQICGCDGPASALEASAARLLRAHDIV